MESKNMLSKINTYISEILNKKEMKKLFILMLYFINNSCANAQDATLVKFKVDASMLQDITNLGIRGSAAPLSWETTYMLQDEDRDGIFEGELRFDRAIKLLEYKYVYEANKLVWERGAQNRILITDKQNIQLIDVWDVQNPFDVKQLPKLSADELSADFKILKNALEEIHPGLYRYNTRNQIDSIFDHFEKTFSTPLSYQEAFLNFSSITSAIKCGHTFPSFYNQIGFIQEVVLNQKDKLPFAFRVLDESIFITESVIDGVEIPLGTEIISIDGIPTASFLKETAKLVKADGDNNGKRYADLNTFGVEGYYEAFDCYFPLLYPPTNGQYTVKIKKPDSAMTEELTVKTVTKKERSDALIRKNPNHITSADQLWRLEFWDNDVAYLQLSTFDAFQLSFEWSDFLRDSFKEIRKRKSKNLIIDIRWNEGGQDEILVFLGQNIANRTIKIPQRQDLVRYKKLSAELRPYLFTWDNGFFDLSQRTKSFDDDFLSLTSENLTEIPPFKNAFTGNTCILVNASNSSATFYLAEIAKENQLATLIGETTGGSQKGLNAGTMFFLRLPHSKIEIDIPIIGSFSKDKPQGGIVPDILVKETQLDIISRNDPFIESAKKYFSKQ